MQNHLMEFCAPVLQTLNGLSEESATDHLEFPLLTQCSLSSITHLLPFLFTLCCSFQGPPTHNHSLHPAQVADYPAASADAVLDRLERIIEEEFLDDMENWMEWDSENGHSAFLLTATYENCNLFENVLKICTEIHQICI